MNGNIPVSFSQSRSVTGIEYEHDAVSLGEIIVPDVTDPDTSSQVVNVDRIDSEFGHIF